MTMLILAFVVLLLINAPIAFVIGGAGLLWFVDAGRNLNVTAQYVISQTQSIAFLAVPFFIFAGNLMNRTGITRHLIAFSRLLTRRMIGGTAQVSVLLSTLMGGVSGSAVADASMEARILGPEMIRRGYTKGYAGGVICVTSLITATIPPSLGLILYGFVGGVSIGKLFIAGILPGIMMMALLMLTVRVTAKRRGFDLPDPNAKRPTWKEIFHELKQSIWAVIFPIILIVGIRFGLFTATEAGSVAVVYALIVGAFVYKELTWKNFCAALKDSFIDNGGIILIIAMSGIFGKVMTMINAPATLDSNVNIMLLTPLFLPVLTQMGVDPVHFGICMMTIVTMGCMTPPVGTALYTVCDILDCPIEQYFKETLPFYAAVIVLVLICVFIPDVIMWLPNLVYGG